MKKVVFILIGSIAVISGVLVADYIINSGFKDVRTESVSVSTVENYIELTGEVTEEEKRDIKSDFPFEITEIYKEIGEYVKKGEKIALFDEKPLINKLELAMAESDNPENYYNIISQIKNTEKTVFSPIDGVISAVNFKKGETVAIDRPVFTITDTENLKIRSKISSDSFNEVYLNQKVIIYADDYAINGKITKIYPIAQKTEGDNLSFIAFEITPVNSEKLTCGTVVDLKLLNEILESIVTVPFDAVMFDEEYPYVYVNVSGYAVKKRVITGKEFETTVEITEGLSVNDKLITEPRKYNIKNGDKISDGE